MVVAGTVAGAAAVEAANLLFPKEKEPEKLLVGGVWVDIKQDQEVPTEFVVKFQAQQRGSAIVHHVTLTASPNTAPNVVNDPNDIEQSQGSWHRVGQERPDQHGMCIFHVDLEALGAKKGQEVIFSTNVLGTSAAGYITGQTINYAPNGELHLKYV